ncbi:hypothetical protein H112_02028 [Trichophyton rubrum D6]|uniref:Uncharacterized protein n=1 Tax=Trichophyton soudanense CBS 452.61 TaxID=1215331 RepID=A0A022Y1J9_TRISD|nr:hypothetical protein H100_02025 [Trichophyton rubrum MR850]EZF44727.1 hypothetical protein H102_02022 [Trichophyton rubrum CBS 100081]EZF66016.1 hypothetical protein H104_02009 [Trichophyton rubrum CBS 289.86]EZF76619.1 hypothetical protein H105_02040 [Trichophyton soudanense CBS 452.61]EZF87317.1 hypothetical protein H110_02032 [Trichophyton rubrum MR1448]EZF98038.1 hypothetical protein H113_02031 [Trichophyton rubrum MR1459]EZG19588.1 hypothetical protein H107_02093 [Trichophyton rubrum 
MGVFAATNARRRSIGAVKSFDCDAAAARWHLPPSCLVLLRAAYRVCQTSNIPGELLRAGLGSSHHPPAKLRQWSRVFPQGCAWLVSKWRTRHFERRERERALSAIKGRPLFCYFAPSWILPRDENVVPIKGSVLDDNMQPSAHTLYGAEGKKE